MLGSVTRASWVSPKNGMVLLRGRFTNWSPMSARTLRAILASSVLVLGTATMASASVGSVPASHCAQPDGRVSAMAITATTLYLGGDFTHVTDSAGVSQPRSRLAAVDTATCDLLPWTAVADKSVTALAVTTDTVYVGGSFLSINGLSRTRIAALDGANATVLPFNPSVNKPVNALLASGTRLYVGGSFTSVSGVSRPMLAAFTLSSGALDPTWTPSANAAVYTLQLGADGTDVYVGGNFTSLNAQSQQYVGAVKADDGSSDAGFVPSFGTSAAFPILNLAADSRGVYAGGGGSGGHLVIWNLDGTLQRAVYQTDGGVQSVAVDGDSLYAGGHFVNYCSGNTGAGHPFLCDTNVPRSKLFEVSLTTGLLTSWAPKVNSARGVFTSAVDPVTHALWVGGDFTKVGSLPVAHLAEFTP